MFYWGRPYRRVDRTDSFRMLAEDFRRTQFREFLCADWQGRNSQPRGPTGPCQGKARVVSEVSDFELVLVC